MSYANCLGGFLPFGLFFLKIDAENEGSNEEWLRILGSDECKEKMLQPVSCNGYFVVSESSLRGLHEMASFNDLDSIGQSGAWDAAATGNSDPMVHGC